MLNNTCEVAEQRTMGHLVVGRKTRDCSLAHYFRNKEARQYSRMVRQLDLEERDNQTALLAQGDSNG